MYACVCEFVPSQMELSWSANGRDTGSLVTPIPPYSYAYSRAQTCSSIPPVLFHRPRSLPIPGFGLKNVLLLREPAQANKIAELAAGKKVVVIGTSFIGEGAVGVV